MHECFDVFLKLLRFKKLSCYIEFKRIDTAGSQIAITCLFVIACNLDQTIISGTANDFVVTGTAVQDVFAAAAKNFVITAGT